MTLRFGLLVLLAACRTAPLTVGGLTDGAVDGSVDAGMFCGNGPSPRAEVNGMLALSPSVSGKEEILNCCNFAGRIDVVSAQLPTTLTLSWRSFAVSSPDPVLVDLAALPMGFSVSLDSGCDATSGVCSDHFSGALSGTLAFSKQNGMLLASACLEASETKPQSVLHEVQLWTPGVVIR